MEQEIGVWNATREWVRAVGKGLLACVVGDVVCGGGVTTC